VVNKDVHKFVSSVLQYQYKLFVVARRQW